MTDTLQLTAMGRTLDVVEVMTSPNGNYRFTVRWDEATVVVTAPYVRPPAVPGRYVIHGGFSVSTVQDPLVVGPGQAPSSRAAA